MWLQAISSVFIGVSVCHSLEVELLHVGALQPAAEVDIISLIDSRIDSVNMISFFLKIVPLRFESKFAN